MEDSYENQMDLDDHETDGAPPNEKSQSQGGRLKRRLRPISKDKERAEKVLVSSAAEQTTGQQPLPFT